MSEITRINTVAEYNNLVGIVYAIFLKDAKCSNMTYGISKKEKACPDANKKTPNRAISPLININLPG